MRKGKRRSQQKNSVRDYQILGTTIIRMIVSILIFCIIFLLLVIHLPRLVTLDFSFCFSFCFVAACLLASRIFLLLSFPVLFGFPQLPSASSLYFSIRLSVDANRLIRTTMRSIQTRAVILVEHQLTAGQGSTSVHIRARNRYRSHVTWRQDMPTIHVEER